MNWRLIVRAATAAAFAAVMVYWIWRLEWFDVFRWGMPGPSLLLVYACYVSAFAAIGWFVAARFTRRLSH